MKGLVAARLGLAIASVFMAGAALAQGVGAPGFGQHRPPLEQALGQRGAGGRWWNNPAMVEKLKLTDLQRKTMDQILLEHRETLVDLRGGVEKAELRLEPLIRDDQPNETGILAQIDKVAQARAELEKANARFLLAIRGTLTPEQWRQLQAERARGAENRSVEGRGWGQGSAAMSGQRSNGPRRNAPGQRPAPPPAQQGGVGQGSSPDATSDPAPTVRQY